MESEPVDRGLPGHNWTLKKLRRWLKQVMDCDLARSSLHRILCAARLGWKRRQKLPKKADPHNRAAFMQRFHRLYEEVWRLQTGLIYIGEVHIHRDMDIGYTWALKGKPAWRLSDSAPLAHRINWYGAYDFTAGRCMIWNEGSCNKEHTIQFLQRIAAWLGDESREVVIIWDGASWNRDQMRTEGRGQTRLHAHRFATLQSRPESDRGSLEGDARRGDTQLLPSFHATPLRRLQSLRRPHQYRPNHSCLSPLAQI